MLCAPEQGNSDNGSYQAVVNEVARGVYAVSQLRAYASEQQGWISIECTSSVMATWLSEAIERENVQARTVGSTLLLPLSADFTVENEIKSLVTVVAKTTDYWYYHLPREVKQALSIQAALQKWKQRVVGWLNRG